jgi:L-amino acid N-acyltransferase YncA
VARLHVDHEQVEVIALRLADPADAAAMAAIYAPFVRDTAISFEWEPPTAEEMRERIERTLPRHPWLVLTEEDAVMGYAYATAYRGRAAYQWSAEISVYVEPRAQGRGIASRLCRALFALLSLQGYRVLYGVIALPNPASVRLHEKAGFEGIGVFPAAGYKHGAWHDVLWMRRALRPLDDDPAPPLALPLLDPCAVAAILR